MVLVGNKCDLGENKVCGSISNFQHKNNQFFKISYAQGKALADVYGMKFIEASAKDATNVEEAFVMLATNIMWHFTNEERDNHELVSLSPQSAPFFSSKSC